MTAAAPTPEQVERFKQLLAFRGDGASMSEAQFQAHVRDEPGFREWLERQGVQA